MAKYTGVILHDNKITPHFYIWEFAHQAGKELYIDNEFIYNFVPALERFRVWYNRPINITSCYRPAAYNAAVGGSPDSAHLRAWAIDTPLPKDYYQMTAARKNEFLQNVKKRWVYEMHNIGRYAQVNFYDNRLHLGMSLKKDNFLDYRGKK